MAQKIERILRLPQVLEATGLPRSSIYEGMAAGTFPRSVPLSERTIGWLESEIWEWQKHRVAARDERAA